MARMRKSKKIRAVAKGLSVSHRARLIEEMRADTELAAEYANAVAADGDPRVYLAALRTVAEAQGMAKVSHQRQSDPCAAVDESGLSLPHQGSS